MAVHDSRLLVAYAGTFRDVQQLRIAAGQRAIAPALVDAMEQLEAKLSATARRELRRHPMWPWLSQFPGLGGVQMATLLARIGDPWRFPGQSCNLGHISPSGQPVGSSCPAVAGDEHCPGVMQDPRPGTGVRALWRYAGLHVVDGHAPRRTRGQRNDWDSRARTALLMPKGIADQLIMKRVEPYRGIYDEMKAHKLAGIRRVSASRNGEGEPDVSGPADTTIGTDHRNGGSADTLNPIDSGLVETTSEFEARSGGSAVYLDESAAGADVHRELLGTNGTGRAHAIARTVAAKAFLGDLLIEWKRSTRGVNGLA